jgi:hypothetical protein
MDSFVRRSPEERSEVFRASAANRGIGRPLIIEKDFWVCWTLAQLGSLFGPPSGAGSSSESAGLLFKGGTSLSKAFGAINRFSEDIDLTIDRKSLGQNFDPAGMTSSQASKLVKRVIRAARGWVADSVVPLISNALSELPKPENAWRVSTDADHNVIVEYPRSLDDSDYGTTRYVAPTVRLEIGARGDVWPAERRTILAYAAQDFPELFTAANVPVNVLALRRTLWEKALILHGIAHRGVTAHAERISRHYYDLDCILQTAEGHNAIRETELLENVADHSALWFSRDTAMYDLARIGTLRLVPDKAVIHALQVDFRNMSEMFFDPPPPFEAILDRLRTAEREINGQP